jgi:hypothetical protein
MTTGVLPRGQSGQGEKLTIDLRLVSRLRINGGIPLVSLHAFMAWPGKTRSLSLSLTLFFGDVYPYLRQKHRWVVGGMGSKFFFKESGRDCNRLLFRNFFVGTEKNHENIGIAGDLVEVDLHTNLKRYHYSSLLGLK